MVTFVGLNNTTRFVRTLTFEFAAMIVMSDCAPLKALPLMLMPPALSDSAVMVPMASTMPFEVATLPVKLIVVGFKRPTSNVPFPAVRVKPPAVTWSSAASSSGLDLAWATAAEISRRNARRTIVKVRRIKESPFISIWWEERLSCLRRSSFRILVCVLHNDIYLSEPQIVHIGGRSYIDAVRYQASGGVYDVDRMGIRFSRAVKINGL